MSKPVPWSVEGGGFDAREAVRAAALQAGLEIDQWLAAAVTDHAAYLGVAPRDLSEDQRVDAIARKMGYGLAKADAAPAAASVESPQPRRPAPIVLAEEAPQIAPAAARNEVGEMIREVGRRLHAFNATPVAEARASHVRSAPARALAVGDGLEPLRRELARLVDLVGDMRKPDAAPSARADMRSELSTLLEALADLCREAAQAQGGAADAGDVAELKRDMALLRDAILDVQRAAAPAEQDVADAMEAIRRDVAALDANLVELEAREEIDALDTALQHLAERVDASREQGLRPSITGPVEELLLDMRDALDDLRRAEPVRALEAQVADLRRVVAALEARGDPADLADLSRQMGDVRDLLERAPAPAQIDRIERQLTDLAGRLARIAERGPSAAGEQAVLDSVESVRADLRASLAQDAFEALEGRLAALCERAEDALARMPSDGFVALHGRFDAMESAFNARMDEAQAIHAQDVERLEGLLRAMSDRLDQPLTRNQLEQVREVVGQLTERFGAADAQPHALRALETRLEEIFTRLGEPVSVEFDTSRIEGMIGDIAGRVDATGAVAAELQGSVARIAHTIERMSATAGGGESLRALEAQIAEIAARLDEPVSAELDTSRLEAMVQSLGERVGTHGDGDALRALERQVEQLGERLEGVDGADSLASLERSVADIFQHIEQFRETALLTAEHAARKAAREALASAASAGRNEGDGLAQLALEREFADLRAQQRAAEQRTNAAIDAVRGMMEQVVDKLASLERRAERAVMPAQPSAPAARVDHAPPRREEPRHEPLRQEPVRQEPVIQDSIRQEPARPEPARAPAIEPAPIARASAAPPVAADLSDMLLEPGAGKPAQSGLVLPGSDEAADGPRASFIAAVRRAQSAASGALAEPAPAESALDQARARARAAASKTQDKPARTAPKMPVGGVAGGGKVKRALRAVFMLAVFGGLLALGARVGLSLLEEPPQQDQAERHGAAAPAPAAQKSELSALDNARAAQPKIAAQAQAQQTQTPPPASSRAGAQVLGQVAATFAPPADPATVASIDKRQPVARPQDLRSAAATGVPAAQFEMAARYADGRGVTKDLAQAAAWFERAAQQEFAPAQYRLGAMYEKGNGVERDLEKAREWYQRAAERGHVRAMHNLAVLIAEGAAGKPDYGTAAQWFRSAAEHGVRDSQYNFAILNARGLGVAQDLVQSYMWFSLAAAQGDEDAARKRADVAARLDARQLSRGRLLVDNFAAKRPDQTVNEALAPPGGWEFSPEPARPARPPASRPRVSSL
jgi:localization factor PodJL